MPVMRSMSGRVWSAAPTPPPRNAEGGVLRERDVAETRHALRQRNDLPVVRRNINSVVIDVYGVDGFAVPIRHQVRVSDVHLNVYLRLVFSIGLLVPLASEPLPVTRPDVRQVRRNRVSAIDNRQPLLR